MNTLKTYRYTRDPVARGILLSHLFFCFKKICRYLFPGAVLFDAIIDNLRKGFCMRSFSFLLYPQLNLLESIGEANTIPP